MPRYDRPSPLEACNIHQLLNPYCDVCGKKRGRVGNKTYSHAKCSAIRKQIGFERGRDERT